MAEFLPYLKRRWNWSAKGVGGTWSWVSFGVGTAMAIVVWTWPDWVHQHISERMSNFVLGLIPFLSGGSVFVVRWMLSSYFVYKATKLEGDRKVQRVEKQKAKLTAKRPDFFFMRDAGSSISWKSRRFSDKPTMITITIKSKFQNKGEGVAYHTGAEVYGCWITKDHPHEPRKIDKIESVERISTGEVLTHTFEADRLQENIENTILVFCYEINWREGSPDGQLSYNLPIWLSWVAKGTARDFTFPSPGEVEIAKSAINELRSKKRS